MAWSIDLCLRVALFSLAMMVMIPLGVIGLEGFGTGLLLLLAFLLEWFYGVFFETLLEGRTPGKWALSLRVVRDDGSPAGFSAYLLRNLLKGVDFLPALFGVGIVAMFLDDRMRRIGDLVAGTVVVAEERSAMLAGVELDPPVSEEERRSLPARVDLTREEIAVIESFLRRRSRFSDERAEELAWLFGRSLSDRTGIEADSWGRVLALAYARATGKDRPPETRGPA